MRLKDLRRNVRYYLLIAPLVGVLSRLPLAAARLLGNALGLLGWALAGSARRRAMENLERAFAGQKDGRELRRICRRVFANAGRGVAEVLVVHRWPPEKIRRVFPVGDDLRQVDTASRAGVVGVTAHFGNWELLGVLFGAHIPGRMVPVARRVYFGKLQELVERMRGGVEAVYTDESPRRMVDALRDGHLLGLLPDQDMKTRSGVFVDFFGKPAYTSTTPVHLALTTGCPMITCYLVREGRRFRVLFNQIPIQDTGCRETDLLENTRRWTRVLEGWIREYPDQWVWFHRRWRTRPGETRRSPRRKQPPGAASGSPPGVDSPSAGQPSAGQPSAGEDRPGRRDSTETPESTERAEPKDSPGAPMSPGPAAPAPPGARS